MVSLGFSPGMPGSVHNDVLSANPTSSQDKYNLIEELKRRGRAAVTSKNYLDADILYGKGVAVLQTLVDSADEEEKAKAKKDIAILYSNRSLSLLQLGKSEDARYDAQKATEFDPTYIKGYWRLGQALVSLSRNTEALEAYEAAFNLDSSNKALKKECEKVRVKIEQEKLLMEASAEEVATTPALPPPVTTTTTKKVVTGTKATKTTTSTNKDAGMKDGTFGKSEHVRGYKIVNGKKTSYFHHEQTEEEKRLIGDIAPKKIDPATTVTNDAVAPEEKDRSAWNKAGTWEERDVSKWAKETLEASLLSAEYTLPEGSPDAGAKAAITKVDKLNGHASYATVRGKKRYIYEFSFCLHWNLTMSNGDVCKGKMTFPDVDTTCDVGDGYEMVHWEVDGSTPQDAAHLISRFVKDGGLRDAIHGKIDGWVDLFKATY